MLYSKYEESIVAVHKVAIEGWPVDIPRVSPQSLSKIEDVKDLYDAWSEGQACWRKLKSKEIREIRAQRDPLEGRVKQSKKGCSSGAQQKRAREHDGDGDNVSGRVKKRKKTQTHQGKEKHVRDEVTDDEISPNEEEDGVEKSGGKRSEGRHRVEKACKGLSKGFVPEDKKA